MTQVPATTAGSKMPIVSKAQQGFMFAHQHDAGPLGVVARDFIEKTPKNAYQGLPAKVAPTKRPDMRAHVLANLAKQYGNS